MPIHGGMTSPVSMATAMSVGPDDHILRQLRCADAKLDRIGRGVQDMKGRLSALEQQHADVQRQPDRVDDRLNLTERPA